MGDEIAQIVQRLHDDIIRNAYGDGASTFASPPEPRPALTADNLTEMMRQFRREYGPPSPQIIEVDPYPVFVQARKHRKRRINKKWRKRYGMKTEWQQLVPTGKVFHDTTRNIVYCNRGDISRPSNLT